MSDSIANKAWEQLMPLYTDQPIDNEKRRLREDDVESDADSNDPFLPFISRKRSYSFGLRHATLRPSVKLIAGLTACAVFIWCTATALSRQHTASSQASSFATTDIERYANESSRLHVLLPANKRSTNLCRLLAGFTALGYPTPSLLAWDENFETKGLLGGGSHLGKIEKVLSYMKSLGPHHDQDLVLMMDAYDIQPQLRPETLIARYHSIIVSSNERLSNAIGAAGRVEEISNKVVFGAGKRCAPNYQHTVACYPLPESPLPADLYGANTDSIIGRNEWYSIRQRFLNSGYIIGTVSAMRPMFEEAWTRSQHTPRVDPEARGTLESNRGYHGSDQSIFAKMLGQQEFQRETLRLRYNIRWWQRLLKLAALRPRSSHLSGVAIDNVLNPSWTHEPFSLNDTTPTSTYEFSITLDYFSEIGHQTINSGTDAQWLIHHDTTMHPEKTTALSQVSEKPRDRFDCPIHLPSALPIDISLSPSPGSAIRSANTTDRVQMWSETPLYTHLCLGTIPAFIHHNGYKTERDRLWPRVWYQPYLRSLLLNPETPENESPSKISKTKHGKGQRGKNSHHYRPQSWDEHRDWPKQVSDGGAWTDKKGEFKTFRELCPPEWDAQIFGLGEKGVLSAQPLDWQRKDGIGS